MNTALLLETAWKSLLVGALVMLLLEVARRRSAAARATIAQAALMSLLLLPLLVWGLPRWSASWWPAMSDSPVAPTSALTPRPVSPFDFKQADLAAEPTAKPVAVRLPEDPGAAYNTPVPALWWLAWSVPVLLLLAALILATRRLAVLSHRARPVADPVWLQALARARLRVDCRRAVGLRATAALNSPISCGWRRPVVLLDVRTLKSALTPDAAEALLAHELAHVVRRDWPALLLARLVVALYWFNPLVWWLAHRAHQLREEAADDLVLRRGALPGPDYAALLVAAARSLAAATAPPSLAHGIAAGGLKARIRRVLDPGLDRSPARRSWRVFCGCAALAVAAPLAALVPAAQLTPLVPLVPTAQLTPLAPLMLGTMPTRSDGPLEISWTLESARAAGADGVQRALLTLSYRGLGHQYRSASDVNLQALSGLDVGRLSDAAASAQGFSLEREAGTLRCSGEGRAGDAAGTCQFAPSASFLDALAARGLEPPDLAQQLQLTLSDVRIDLLDEFKRQGYDTPDIERLVEAGIHGVRPEWLAALGSIGYRAESVARLVEFRIHGVDADYIRDLAAVEPAYARLDPRQLVEFRIHGLTADAVRALAAAGYTGLEPQQLVEMAIHDVMPEYISALAEQGYSAVPPAELLEMRIHGITPKRLSELAAMGYRQLSPSTLVEMHIHGVSPGYISELASLGYRDLSPEKLVELRIHGVSPDYIRARLADRGEGRELTVDRLVEMKIMGN